MSQRMEMGQYWFVLQSFGTRYTLGLCRRRPPLEVNESSNLVFLFHIMKKKLQDSFLIAGFCITKTMTHVRLKLRVKYRSVLMRSQAECNKEHWR